MLSEWLRLFGGLAGRAGGDGFGLDLIVTVTVTH